MAPSLDTRAKTRTAASAMTLGASEAEIDLSSPLFNPAQYLAVTHANMDFLDLQTALTNLRKTTSDKTAQLKALVSAHFDQYLSCHEAVRVLAMDVSAHQQDTETLLGDMKNLSQVTDTSLAVMLHRAREQRRIRHTLAVLARLRPILELTSKMKASLRIEDYESLALNYARLKYQSNKIANLVAPLKRVVAAGHEIAAAANAELLQRLEDVSASATDQKRAMDVLASLGLVEKPILTCLTKQFEYLERKLVEIDVQGASQITSDEVMKECVAIASRFHNGLWDFVCELFKTPAGSASATYNAVTSLDAERVQQQAWRILSKCADLLEHHAAPPSALRLRLLTDAFRQLGCLKKCPNASMLNSNIEKLNDSFCNKFRAAITLAYLDQVCQSAQSELLAEYFEPVVAVLPSLSSETTLGLCSLSTLMPVMSTDPRTKIQRMLIEARQAFDVVKNASTISSESKILLHRPPVFTTCATDILQCWKSIWQDVGQVLLNVLDIVDRGSPAVATNDVDSHFRAQLIHTLEKHLRDMLSAFLDKVMAAFVAEITPSVPVKVLAGGVVQSNRKGARVCILLAVVANCVELREKCLRIVDGWMAQLRYGDIDEDECNSTLEHGRAATSSTRALSDVVQSVETKCMDIYSTAHAEPLQCIFRAGAAEEPLLPHSSSSSNSRHNSRLNRSSSGAFPVPSASSPLSSIFKPSDPRQYVFNVLLQLITLRGEIETSVGEYPQCWEYILSITDPLTAALAEFVNKSVRNLENSSSMTTLSLDEWRRSHLLVETRFFQLALTDLMAENTKTQLEEIEKKLSDGKSGEQAMHAGHLTLFNQMKHQTKLYLLALRR